ncbi:MAG: sugar phosphate isomerase/epimerase family protein [Lacipirellulaceae bacterium]
MRLGYNTNGLVHHSLPAAIELLASLGYESVAITLDHACLNPFSPDHERELEEAAALLKQHGLRSVIETGARYLLDPREKHQPTLVSPRSAGRPRRIEFLRHAIDTAAALGSDCVSLWSGVLPSEDSREIGMERLVKSLSAVLDYAERRDVILGFEPEPGMLIDTMDSFSELLEAMFLKKSDSDHLQLTLDLGHLHCLGEGPIEQVIKRWSERLVNIHIEDMRAGVHEHLMFGEGEIDFPPILSALQDVNYQGGLHVELSRHSHIGPGVAARSIKFLKSLAG